MAGTVNNHRSQEHTLWIGDESQANKLNFDACFEAAAGGANCASTGANSSAGANVNRTFGKPISGQYCFIFTERDVSGQGRKTRKVTRPEEI